jgi:hypothetical protein
MEIVMVTLDELRKDLGDLGRDRFIERYSGAFLVAMGFLSVEEIRQGTGKRPRKMLSSEVMVSSFDPGDEVNETAAFKFGKRIRHDAARKHPLAGCAFHLRPGGSGDTLTVGRSKHCHLTIPETGVSENHCRIQLTERGVTVTDTDSTNGTKVNMRQLEPNTPTLLADEDILSLGRYSFQMLSVYTFYDEIQALVGDID